jgi:hypothetical protein
MNIPYIPGNDTGPFKIPIPERKKLESRAYGDRGLCLECNNLCQGESACGQIPWPSQSEVVKRQYEAAESWPMDSAISYECYLATREGNERYVRDEEEKRDSGLNPG